ncbi:hypothetical protein KHC28_24000 [Ancylobacter sonchi]|uniref:hypothetical protein n=1 Tax=Ancylobacter sonchi TaxID=1937790 RepID=UPI001BD38236|nr:hypothetical protein [Ancylobacter sonchi]MBS7536720.1 hypothetical protein [Ancylobacter sonchi]
MTTVSFPTLIEAQAASAPSPLPDYVHVLGCEVPSDGGATLYALASGDMPTEGEEKLVAGSFDTSPTGWTLTNWTWSAGSISGAGVAAGEVRTPALSGLTPYMTWTLRGSASGVTGETVVTMVNTLHNRYTREVGRITANGAFEIKVTTRPSDSYIRLNNAAGVTCTLEYLSFKEITDEGQQTIFASAYVPVPSDGMFTIEMFGGRLAGESTDDMAFIRLLRRIYSLGLNLSGHVHVRMNGRYKFLYPWNVLWVAEGVDVTLDFGGNYMDFTEAPYKVVRPWVTVQGPGYTGWKTTLAANAARNDATVTAATTTGLSAGDFIAVTSTIDYYNGISEAGGYALQYNGELVQIRNPNAGGNVIGIGDALSFDYTANSTNIRRFGMGGVLRILGGHAIGPGHSSVAGDDGTTFIDAMYFETVYEEKLLCENWASSTVDYMICANVVLDTPITIGRRMADPTNAGPISAYCYGRMVNGCLNASIDNPSGRHCRRAVDLGAAGFVRFAYDYASGEGVISRNISMTGGESDDTQTQPGGHLAFNWSLTGHVGRNIRGMQIRGKNVRLTACYFETRDGGSIGINDYDDPSLYGEDPTQGEVILDNVVLKSTATDSSFIAHQSTDRLVIRNSRIEAVTPFAHYGRHQSNVEFDRTAFVCTSSATPASGRPPCVASQYRDKSDGSNWRVDDCYFDGGSVALYMLGSTVATVSEIRVRRALLKDIATSHLFLSRSGAAATNWATDGSLEVSGSIEMGSVPSTKLDTSTLVVAAFDNSWGSRFPTIAPVTSVLTLQPHRGDVIGALVSLSAATDLVTIAGAADWQIVVLTLATNTYALTVKNTGNIRVKADITLDHSRDTITLIKRNDGNYYPLAFSDNGP